MGRHLRRLLPCVVLAMGVLTGCADVIQRYRTVGLTENQRTDLELFETVVRFAQDSFGGPFKVHSSLSNSGWPTVGLEPDSSRADQNLSIDARRGVLRRLGIEEAEGFFGNDCVIESKWEVASLEHEYHCPEVSEMRVLIGPFYQVSGKGWLAGDPDVMWANVARLRIGPRGFVVWSYEFELRRASAGWRVHQVRLTERRG